MAVRYQGRDYANGQEANNAMRLMELGTPFEVDNGFVKPVSERNARRAQNAGTPFAPLMNAQQPRIDAISNFYQLAYGSGLSERGRAEATQYFAFGAPLGKEFDPALNFERAFSFLIQQREDMLSESMNSLGTGGGGGMASSFTPSMSNRVPATTYSGANVMGI